MNGLKLGLLPHEVKPLSDDCPLPANFDFVQIAI